MLPFPAFRADQSSEWNGDPTLLPGPAMFNHRGSRAPSVLRKGVGSWAAAAGASRFKEERPSTGSCRIQGSENGRGSWVVCA